MNPTEHTSTDSAEGQARNFTAECVGGPYCGFLIDGVGVPPRTFTAAPTAPGAVPELYIYEQGQPPGGDPLKYLHVSLTPTQPPSHP